MNADRGAQQPRGPIVVVAIVAGLCSGIASALVLHLAENESAKIELPGASRPTSDAAELAAIRQELAGLRQQVAQLRLPTSGSNLAADTPAVPTSLAPEAQLATLTVAVNDLAKRLDSMVPPHIPPPGPRDDLVRKSLEPFFDKKKVPPTDSYLYFTEAELLGAFGPPNTITANEKGTVWLYFAEQDGSVAAQPRSASFQFAGGRVVECYRY